MTTPTPDVPNAEQITYWNEQAGPRWVGMQRLIDEQIGPLGLALIERTGLRAGERVLDVGCGCGSTSLTIAERVRPGGAVTGVDVSTPMLAEARRRAAETGATAVDFVQADAQTHPFSSGAFDVAFSRFGVMFFADPVAAFANLRLALRPGGRLAVLCWQALDRNPWLLVPLGGALRHVPPPPPPVPGEPGPFSLADPARLRAVLGGAGLADVQIEPLERDMTLGGGDDPLGAAVTMMFEVGPAAALVRDVDAATRDRVAGAMREALEPFLTPAGIRLGAAAWIVTAVRAEGGA